MTDPTSSKTDSNLQSFSENQKDEIALKQEHQNFEFQSNEDSLSSVRNQDSQKTNKIKTKAAREKARREKLNERFTCLANLSNPEDPKTDKASILMDTIRSMKALKLENDQLKQLNKFLEERVTLYEKERNFAIYQQSMMFNPESHGFSLNQGGLCPAGPLLDLGENGMTVLGTPMEVKEDKQELCDVDQELAPQWSSIMDSSMGPEDDFLHPPAA